MRHISAGRIYLLKQRNTRADYKHKPMRNTKTNAATVAERNVLKRRGYYSMLGNHAREIRLRSTKENAITKQKETKYLVCFFSDAENFFHHAQQCKLYINMPAVKIRRPELNFNRNAFKINISQIKKIIQYMLMNILYIKFIGSECFQTF